MDHPVICTDTRKIAPGCIFFALKGPNHDGNQFASEALAKGAAYAVVSDPDLKGASYLLVEDTLDVLQRLATYHRNQFDIPVLGITGSNGKTTTKGLFKSVLQQKYRTHATRGNLNNHIGVPLTLLEMGKGTEFAIIEMGANHVGEIAALCEIARPDAGLITNIGKAHLEGFGGIEGVFKGKSELYHYIRSVHGTFFLNAEDPYLVRHLQNDPDLITYGHSEDFDFHTTRLEGDSALKFKYSHAGKDYLFESSLYGDYNLINMTAAVAVGVHYGVPVASIQEGIARFRTMENRSQVIRKGDKTIVLDAYNANPTSMRSAIDAFRVNFGRGLLVLGDMKELGEESEKYHQEIVDQLAEDSWPEVVLVGEEFGKVNRPAHFMHFRNVEKLKDQYSPESFQQTSMLVKGSRSMRLEAWLDQENS